MMPALLKKSPRTACLTLIDTRAERLLALFGAHPEAVVVRREALGGDVLCALTFCAERDFRPLAVWRDDTAIEVAMTPDQYDEYLSAMAAQSSKQNSLSSMQTIYWKDIERLEGWCWMQVPAYSIR